MKNTLYLILVTVLALAASPVWGQTFGGGNGTETDPYLITSATEWVNLAGKVGGGNSYSGVFFKQTANISITSCVGDEAHAFSGTFDGNGYTIDMTFENASIMYAAPFRYIDGATIRGVHLVGTLSSTSPYAGCIVGYAKGTSTVTNCINSSHIINMYSGGNAYDGGIVGEVSTDGSIINITNCLFNGTMSEGNASSHDNWSGILGICDYHCTANISNCLVDPINTVTNGKTFYRNYSTTHCINCYYTKLIGYNAQGGTNGSNMTAAQLADSLGNSWHVENNKAVPYLVPFTLGDIPNGWTMTANGNPVAVTNGTAVVFAGSEAVLTPTDAKRVMRVTLKDAPAPIICTGKTINLQYVSSDTVAQDGDTLTGTLGANVKVSIADGATVTLAGVSINANGSFIDDNWAGITCLGDATIILKDGTTNTVKGFNDNYPGIFAAVNKTLTIQGTGSLNASSNGYGAGIGGGYGKNHPCGNINIQGGIITATGGYNAAGIGGGGIANNTDGPSCGTISMSGGTITAQGGENAAGIGSGNHASCSAINISGGTIIATGGTNSAGAGAGAGIGSGNKASCGSIIISGGTITATGGTNSAGAGAGIGSGYKASCGSIIILGGTTTATGGNNSAGIGSGNDARCSAISIAKDVTKVTATKGLGATNSIGKGHGSNAICGTVTIGSTVYYQYNAYVGIGSTYLAQNPLVYPAPNPIGTINGLFSVSSNKQVYFSWGNLQYQGSTDKFRFAERQYTYVGNTAGNHAPSASQAEWIDLFGWGTSGYNNKYPYMTSTTNSDYGNGNNDIAGTDYDWGVYNKLSNQNKIMNGGNYAWRTLTKDEWVYVFNARTTGNTINNTPSARYTEATINTDGTSVNGIILFPNGSIGNTPTGVTWGTINSSSSWGTQCTTAGWNALESAGCVFLPAAGFRDNTITNAGSNGRYWSSSYNNTNSNTAYNVYFDSSNVEAGSASYRHHGYSVRLVVDAD